MHLLRRARATFATLGTSDALAYGVDRSLKGLSRGSCRLIAYRLVAQPIPAPRLTRPRATATIEVRRLEPDEIPGLAFPRPDWIIRHRLRQGCVCFGAFRGPDMVGFLWLAIGDYLEDEVRCRFRPEPADACAWDFDVYVAPEYRLGRTFARLWESANDWLYALGFRWTMSRISAFNTASLAAHRRLGAEFVGRAFFLRIGRGQVALIPSKPWVHLSRERTPLVRVVAPARASR